MEKVHRVDVKSWVYKYHSIGRPIWNEKTKCGKGVIDLLVVKQDITMYFPTVKLEDFLTVNPLPENVAISDLCSRCWKPWKDRKLI